MGASGARSQAFLDGKVMQDQSTRCLILLFNGE